MADDKDARSYRPGNPFARGGTTDQSGAAGQGGDPLAELARLIGQHDPFAEFGRGAAPRDARASAPPPGAPPADWRAARGGRGQEGYRDYPAQPSEHPVSEGRGSYAPDYRPTDRGGEAPASDERYVESPRFDTPHYRDPHYGEEADGPQEEVHEHYGE